MTPRRTVTGYLDSDGTWRELNEPNGLATARQLVWLNARGLLELSHRHGRPLTKGEAAAAIDTEATRD